MHTAFQIPPEALPAVAGGEARPQMEAAQDPWPMALSHTGPPAPDRAQ